MIRMTKRPHTAVGTTIDDAAEEFKKKNTNRCADGRTDCSCLLLACDRTSFACFCFIFLHSALALLQFGCVPRSTDQASATAVRQTSRDDLRALPHVH